MMNGRDGPDGNEIQDIAIDWWVCQRGSILTPQEQRAFDEWLVDPAHAAVYREIENMCGELDRLDAPSPARVATLRRASITRGRLALAGVALVAVVIWLLPADILLAWRADFATPVGETRVVTLADGSHVHLNARSGVAVHFEGRERRISLLYGEAWFDVAKNPERPFVVEAGKGSVTARGTAFDVALEADRVRVSVTEHSVRVVSGGAETLVSEGEQTAYSEDAPAARPSAANMGAATAWRRRKLIFEDRPLGEALEALGRYRRGLVYCLPASLCGRRVTGVFGADDPAQALREIEAYLGLKAVRLSDYLIVLHE